MIRRQTGNENTVTCVIAPRKAPSLALYQKKKKKRAIFQFGELQEKN
jgi:hypothetical protein